MTNREWLNSLNNEELAKHINDECLCCDCCVKCIDGNHYCISNEASYCENGIKKWLDAKHEKTMPKIKEGDIFLYAEKSIVYFGVCVYGNILYLPDKGKCCNFGGEIKEKVFSIRRYSIAKGTMEDIWRADK